MRSVSLTRQIITAVAGALAIGAGLIAARLSGSVNPAMVTIVMILAVTYVAITILSGVSFTLLQRSVRKAWQPRLYRFLTPADYASLVGGPAKKAEIALWTASALGAIAAALMALAISQMETPPVASQKTVLSPEPRSSAHASLRALPASAPSNRTVRPKAMDKADTTESAVANAPPTTH